MVKVLFFVVVFFVFFLGKLKVIYKSYEDKGRCHCFTHTDHLYE